MQIPDVVRFRHTCKGRTWWETSAYVVADDDVVALCWTEGTTYRRPEGDDRLALLESLARGEWDLEEATWWGGPALQVIPEGASWSIWPYRGHDGAHIAWYCNLQAPLQRTDDGFVTNDWTLDVVASPDLSSWRWKDEDELAHGVACGLYSEDDVVGIRAAGADVIARIEAGDPLFETWAAWQLDPVWPAPLAR